MTIPGNFFKDNSDKKVGEWGRPGETSIPNFASQALSEEATRDAKWGRGTIYIGKSCSDLADKETRGQGDKPARRNGVKEGRPDIETKRLGTKGLRD